METAIVTVRLRDDHKERDFEIPVDVEAGKVACLIADALGLSAADSDAEPEFRLYTILPGENRRELGREQRLCDAGVWDGAILELDSSPGHSSEPEEAGELAYRIGGKKIRSRPLGDASSEHSSLPG